jgi:hypothetical protein
MSTIVWCVAFGVAADALVPWYLIFMATCISSKPAVTGGGLVSVSSGSVS